MICEGVRSGFWKERVFNCLRIEGRSAMVRSASSDTLVGGDVSLFEVDGRGAPRLIDGKGESRRTAEFGNKLASVQRKKERTVLTTSGCYWSRVILVLWSQWPLKC